MSISLPREAPPLASVPTPLSGSPCPATSTASRASRPPPAAPIGSEGPSPFAKMLHGLGQESVKGEAMMKSALTANGKTSSLGSADLLALQAGVYRYGEVVDLASRLVDRASSGVKTVIQGQGQ